MPFACYADRLCRTRSDINLNPSYKTCVELCTHFFKFSMSTMSDAGLFFRLIFFFTKTESAAKENLTQILKLEYVGIRTNSREDKKNGNSQKILENSRPVAGSGVEPETFGL